MKYMCCRAQKSYEGIYPKIRLHNKDFQKGKLGLGADWGI